MGVNGTRMFVDDRGGPGAPALLYIHGGPGQGCYDFMRSQGDLLARRLRVVGVDQRGTLRSDPLPAAPALTADLLIADFEALRAKLRIEAWAILGHSAGGMYALRYVTSHIGAVRAVIFDCPCWDADLADRHRLPVVARRLRGTRAAGRRGAVPGAGGPFGPADVQRRHQAGDAGTRLLVHGAVLPRPG